MTGDHHSSLARLRRLSVLLDSAFRIPGTSFRIGLDPLIGLIPGAGDLVAACFSAYIVFEARRIGVPRRILATMTINVLADLLVGSVPILGDIFDFAFKANERNLRRLEQFVSDRSAPRST